MKAIKRTVAALLATLMLATSTSFTLAAEYNYSAKDAEAVGKVSAAQIMVGDENGDFMPEKSLTRAEAAKIIVVMKGISESAVKAAAGTTMFNDVEASNWASGYINQASKLGIVKGVSATEFAPTREVTIQEFVTMAVRALGAGQLVDSEGTWPANYVNFANENKILDDVNALPSNTAKRVEAAMIVKNCLTAEMWGKTAVKTNGEITWEKNGKTIIDDVLDLEEVPVCGTAINAKEHSIKLASGSYDVVESFDLSNIKAGITYHAFKNNKGELTGLWIEDDSVEFTAISEGYDATDKVITLKVDGKDKEYKIAAAAEKVIKNEKATSDAITTVGKNKDAFGTVTLNEKNEIVTMSIYQYDTYFVVDEVTKSYVKPNDAVIAKDYDNISTGLKHNVEDDDYSLTRNGKSISYTDLEEGDAVRLYKVADFDGEGNNKYVGEVIDSIDGKVTAKGTDYIKLDGKKYTTRELVKTPSVKYLAEGIKVNDEIKAYVNNAGDIVMYEIDKEDKSEDVAIVTYKKGYKDKYGDSNFDVKVTFMDGKESEMLSVDLEETYEEVKDAFEDFAITNATTVKLTDSKNLTVATLSKTTIADLTTADKEKIGFAYAADKLSLGGLICYELNGSKLTVVPEDDEFTATDSVQIKVGKKATFLTKTKDSASGEYYFDKNTVVYNVKKDNDYKWKVELVSIDDLDDTDLTAGQASVVGFDADDSAKLVDYVIINSGKFARTTETNFAYIKEIAETKYDDKKADEVTFIMMDGTEKSYIYAASEANNENVKFGQTNYSAGDIVDLEVNGDLIMDAKLPSSPEALGKVDASFTFLKDVVDGRIIVAKADESTEEYFLDEEVLVVRVKSNQDSAVKKIADLSDINEVDFDDTTKADVLTAVWTYKDEDGETSVIAVVYYDIDDYKA